MSNPKDEPVDFDDLLALDAGSPEVASEAPKAAQPATQDPPQGDPDDAPEPTPDAPTPAPSTSPNSPTTEETPEQRRIRELEAALAAPLPTAESEPEAEEKTEEQRYIEELEHRLAQRNTQILESAPERFIEDSGPGQKVLIHFLEDGFMGFGQIWSKGQEIEVVVGSDAWKRSVDSQGKSWLDLRNDLSGQRKRYGKIMFAEGPYAWREGEEFDVTVAKADARRGRRVPAPTVV